MKLQELLGGVRVLGVLHDHLVEEQVRLGRHAHRPDRVRRVLDVGRHLLELGIGRVLGRVVDRDAVVGDRDLAVQEGLVVVRVQPRQRARNEGRVQLLAVLERLHRLRAVDDDLVVGIDQLAAEGPDQPVAPQPVAGGIAQRHAAGRALGMQRLHQLQEVVGVLREGVEAGRLDLALAVHQHRAGGAERRRRSTSCRPGAGRPRRPGTSRRTSCRGTRPGRSRRAACPGTGWRRRWSTG